MKQEQITAFYDEFSDRLLNDFLKGNRRVLSAIQFSLLNIPIDVEHLLDIGCGIGWSSYELARHFPTSNVMGADLSPKLIQRANQLFSLKNLQFNSIDVTSGQFQRLSNNEYDVVVLIDVFEHIQTSARQDFCQQINTILKPEGRVIMTFPSPAHLEWYKEKDPGKLQPVDNNVTLEDLQGFARWINGNILHFKYKSIWNDNDYIHTILKKGKVHYNPQTESRRLKKIHQLSSFQRAKLVKKAYPSVKVGLMKEFLKSQLKKVIPNIFK